MQSRNILLGNQVTLPLNPPGKDEVLPMRIRFRIVENFFGAMCFPYEILR